MRGHVVDYFLLTALTGSQLAYTASLALTFYLRSLPVNRVDMAEADTLGPGDYPYIVLFYPVLRELEDTMRTTFRSLSRLDYPSDRFRVVAIPNQDDALTARVLRKLAARIPLPRDPRGAADLRPGMAGGVGRLGRVRQGLLVAPGPARRRCATLPPKKTRQLVYAFYKLAPGLLDRHGDFLVNYIDADSCPPPDHFLAAAVGIRHYDVLQSTNVAGNLNDTMAASFHAMDHMAWDGQTYPHLSADGRQPYWVLGKGLFFKASDLVALGGFHPWITIEDPEVGMRFWTNGKRLGIIENPLIEEVPTTFAHGITQRKRWVAGFFQSLGSPLVSMGMTPADRARAWLNFLPCLSLSANSVGLPVGLWALWRWWTDSGTRAAVAGLALRRQRRHGWRRMMASQYRNAWRRSALVLATRRDAAAVHAAGQPAVPDRSGGCSGSFPLVIGFRMYLQDGGLVWERTVKINANNDLIAREDRRSPRTVRPGAIRARPQRRDLR